jgi:carbamoyltransferase
MVPSARCCLAGGVALNCVANGYLLRNGPFKELYVQPASGDAGGCIGAALLACTEALQAPPLREPLRDADLGPSYANDYIARLLGQIGIEALDFRDDEGALLAAVVDRLARGKILGWFHGRMEFGPRALGRRSIIADPRGENTRDKINEVVKKREGFRPFAPSVRLEDAAEHFDLDHPSPFMLEVCQIDSALSLPAITHVDGSARPQTVHALSCPRYWRLIEEFGKRTGCPVLLNTSFNVRGEPIVCSPEDALICLANSELDGVVLENFVVDRATIPDDVMQLLTELAQQVEDATGSAQPESAVYTFG